MTKIKVYIITYKKNDILNTNLKSLWQNTKDINNIDVKILANHPDIVIDEENKRPNLKIIMNETRMPNAWGYLSRDWNYCILDGFKTWENPENVDWVVMAQNDVTWIKDWDSWLKNNNKYDFISQPRGDQAMAINIEAVKKVGFFDERFTTLHFQEQDYFIRLINKIPYRISINDGHKGSTISRNEVGNVITNTSFSGFSKNDQTFHNEKNWAQSNRTFSKKWVGIDWNTYLIDCLPFEINWYPFFFDGYKEDLNFESDALESLTYHKESNKRIIPFWIRLLSCFIPSKELRRKIRGQEE